MGKLLSTFYVLSVLLTLVSVEKMVMKANAAECYVTLGACESDYACRQACQQQRHGQGYCEFDAKPNLPRVCTCQYTC